MIETSEKIIGNLNSSNQITGNVNVGVIKGGSSDYNELENKPLINDVKLIGNVSLEELGIQPKGDYAEKTDIPVVPTKLSDLEDDKGYITDIPEEYITEEELNNKGYITSEYVDNKLGDIETILSSLTTISEEV